MTGKYVKCDLCERYFKAKGFAAHRRICTSVAVVAASAAKTAHATPTSSM